MEICRLTKYPVINTPMFMTFPLHEATYGGASAYSHYVTSIMDHDLLSWEVDKPQYGKNDIIVTYLGESFKITPLNRIASIGDETSMNFDGFLNQPAFVYKGSSLGLKVLNYDGHPGYDYGSDPGTSVYAVAEGDIVTLVDFPGSIIQKYAENHHAVIIQHNQGFCSVYAHLASSDYMDMTSDKWIPKSGHVTKDTIIGNVGGFLRKPDGSIKQLAPHLHFEVWRKDGSQWVMHDPYGQNSQSGQAIYNMIWKLQSN